MNIKKSRVREAKVDILEYQSEISKMQINKTFISPKTGNIYEHTCVLAWLKHA